MDGYTGCFFISILEMEMDHLMSCLFCESFCGIHVSALYMRDPLFSILGQQSDLQRSIRSSPSPMSSSRASLTAMTFWLCLSSTFWKNKLAARCKSSHVHADCTLVRISFSCPGDNSANTTSRLLSSIINNTYPASQLLAAVQTLYRRELLLHEPTITLHLSPTAVRRQLLPSPPTSSAPLTITPTRLLESPTAVYTPKPDHHTPLV